MKTFEEQLTEMREASRQLAAKKAAIAEEVDAQVKRHRAAFSAMADEQAEDYAEYLKRCGGVPVSKIKP